MERPIVGSLQDWNEDLHVRNLEFVLKVPGPNSRLLVFQAEPFIFRSVNLDVGGEWPCAHMQSCKWLLKTATMNSSSCLCAYGPQHGASRTRGSNFCSERNEVRLLKYRSVSINIRHGQDVNLRAQIELMMNPNSLCRFAWITKQSVSLVDVGSLGRPGERSDGGLPNRTMTANTLDSHMEHTNETLKMRLGKLGLKHSFSTVSLLFVCFQSGPLNSMWFPHPAGLGLLASNHRPPAFLLLSAHVVGSWGAQELHWSLEEKGCTPRQTGSDIGKAAIVWGQRCLASIFMLEAPRVGLTVWCLCGCRPVSGVGIVRGKVRVWEEGCANVDQAPKAFFVGQTVLGCI